MNKENPTDKPKHLTSTVAFNNAAKKSPRRQLLMKRAGGEFVFYTFRHMFGTDLQRTFVQSFISGKKFHAVMICFLTRNRRQWSFWGLG